MKRLFVIGNGFDIHHDLPTRYKNFRDYVKNVDSHVYCTIEELLKCYCGNQNVNDWNEIEDNLRLFQNMDYEEVLENDVISCAEIDMEKSYYWYSPKCLASEYVEGISKLELYFNEWVNSVNVDSATKDSRMNFTSDDVFLTFNYTETLQRVYNIEERQIRYIHGKNAGDRVFGYNHPSTNTVPLPLTKVPKSWDNEYDAEIDLRIEDAKRILNKIPELFEKDCNNIIMQNISFFDKIKDYNQIIFLGWALGKQDGDYMNKILSEIQNKNVSISVVYYSSDDLNRYHDYFKRREYDDEDVLYCTWDDVELVFA